jgi:hypothetical protein
MAKLPPCHIFFFVKIEQLLFCCHHCSLSSLYTLDLPYSLYFFPYFHNTPLFWPYSLSLFHFVFTLPLIFTIVHEFPLLLDLCVYSLCSWDFPFWLAIGIHHKPSFTYYIWVEGWTCLASCIFPLLCCLTFLCNVKVSPKLNPM